MLVTANDQTMRGIFVRSHGMLFSGVKPSNDLIVRLSVFTRVGVNDKMDTFSPKMRSMTMRISDWVTSTQFQGSPMDGNSHEMNHRDRQILCGLFLSKFDQEGLAYLGFEGFTEAFNALGYSLQARPASIKNYRDELDPYFPNPRKGWHKRPLRAHCQYVLNVYKDADIGQIGELIKNFLMPSREVESIPEVKRVLSIHDAEASSSFAKRLITGKAAEQYFAANYSAMQEFSGLTLIITTGWGCGFDFKLAQSGSESFCAVEVKGLRTRCGQIQLTDLEHDMAEALRERYFLVLVRNFAEEPFHTVINNPTDCAITFTKVERKEIRVSWTATVGE